MRLTFASSGWISKRTLFFSRSSIYVRGCHDPIWRKDLHVRMCHETISMVCSRGDGQMESIFLSRYIHQFEGLLGRKMYDVHFYY